MEQIPPCTPSGNQTAVYHRPPAAIFTLNNISDLVLQPVTTDMVANSKSFEV